MHARLSAYNIRATPHDKVDLNIIEQHGRSSTVKYCDISNISYAYMIAYEVIFRIISEAIMKRDRIIIRKDTRQAREQRLLCSVFYYSH